MAGEKSITLKQLESWLNEMVQMAGLLDKHHRRSLEFFVKTLQMQIRASETLP